MSQLFYFKAKLPGQGIIPVLANSPEQAYQQLLADLRSFYPSDEQFYALKKQINLFPLTEQDYFQNEVIETVSTVPSRRITLRSN